MPLLTEELRKAYLEDPQSLVGTFWAVADDTRRVFRLSHVAAVTTDSAILAHQHLNRAYAEPVSLDMLLSEISACSNLSRYRYIGNPAEVDQYREGMYVSSRNDSFRSYDDRQATRRIDRFTPHSVMLAEADGFLVTYTWETLFNVYSLATEAERLAAIEEERHHRERVERAVHARAEAALPPSTVIQPLIIVRNDETFSVKSEPALSVWERLTDIDVS